MVGVDEVGRGCWAGPLLVVAAKPNGLLPAGLRDSKLMSKKQRQVAVGLLASSCRFGEGWVSVAEIDELGLAGAMRLGTKRALLSLGVGIKEPIIMDGKVNYAPVKYKNVKAVVDADATIPAVSAAGIYAKVKRDDFMAALRNDYPDYGFDKHVGYGTLLHRLALEKHGALRGVHRMSFRPLQSFGGTI